jgi:hypothetical protein
MSETTNEVRSKKSVVVRILLWGAAVLLALLVAGGWWLWSVAGPPSRINTLPPDEELIAWFQTNRADIEELVRRYRAYVPPEGKQIGDWEKVGDTPELHKRAGVSRLSDASSAVWLPDPYSAVARIKDGGYLAVDWRQATKYKTLVIHSSDKRWWQGRVWKDLVYFPMVPRIEDGRIMHPVEETGVSRPTDRVLSTLNNEPPDVNRDECALRQIEPQWFVRMCRVIY